MAQNISGLFSYVTHRRLQEAEESSAETPERLFLFFFVLFFICQRGGDMRAVTQTDSVNLNIKC